MQNVKVRGFDIKAVQDALSKEKLDGWLFYFFHENDPLALHILGLHADHFVSRRWFYYVPAKGEPKKLVHRIEDSALDSLPGEKIIYVGWRELETKLKSMLSDEKRVAMQYSPGNAIPYISRVDAGTVELVRSCGCEVLTSADLVSQFEATWTEAQLESHRKANENLRRIVFEAFAEVRKVLQSGGQINEFELQQFIMRRFDALQMTTNSPPIVAVNEHSGSPHYQPTEKIHSPICTRDFLLLDVWAKLTQPADAVYADITWTGFVGEAVPEKYAEIFQIVSGARDAAVAFVQDSVKNKRAICGWQVDDVSRGFISSRGYGDYFVHRTGHSIGLEVHANGANIDNLETRDERRLIPFTCFSIEPGIYLPEFGVRSEIDVYISDSDVQIAGQPIQTAVIPIMSNTY